MRGFIVRLVAAAALPVDDLRVSLRWATTLVLSASARPIRFALVNTAISKACPPASLRPRSVSTLWTGIRRSGALGLLGAALLGGCGPSSGDLYSGELPERVDFNFHVKPILSDRCFACHGPDDAAREADLRLDTPEGLRRVTDAGFARTGKLLRRILSGDAREVMPPPDSHLELSAYEKAILTRWVEQGAEYQPHWSFLPPRKPELPAVKDARWPGNEIDRFVLSRLEREGLEPSPEAERERLIRRVSYDLTGLPPTLAEVDAFLADRSADAYEKVVDRLLASPAYGERMATEWLDLARYADSHGYQDDGVRHMWPWRDWVIQAFNRNQPYDEFVTWQLAGDLLPNATRQQILATGFNRNHPQTAEGGVVDEEYRVEYVADRANTFGRAFLGLTMECARCHDHKYDPISQKEYYQLYAFFNTNNEIGMTPIDGNAGPMLLLLSDDEQKELGEVRAEMIERERALREYMAEVAKSGYHLRPPRDLQPSLSRGLVGHFPLDVLRDKSSPNIADPRRPGTVAKERVPRLVPGKKGRAIEISDRSTVSVEDAYEFDRTDPFTVTAWIFRTKQGEYHPILGRQERGNRTHRGYELALRGDTLSAAVIHHWPSEALQVTAKSPLPLDEWIHVAMSYDGSSTAAGLRIYIDGELAPVKVDADHLERTTIQDVPFLIGGRTGRQSLEGGLIDEVRVYDRTLSSLELAEIAGLAPLERFQEVPPADWSAARRAELLEYHLYSRDRQYARKLRSLRDSREKENRLLSAAADVMVMQEMPRPRPTFLLDRGLYDAPAERVEPGTPASLGEFPQTLPRNRLGLARWLFAPDHPLTARVAVNRYWQMLFGTGLVKTSDDFGNQGELPTHPELLDWLAVTFRESGWDTRALLKKMVMSSTYRQSSRTTPEHRNKDPENRLLARGATGRLPAEMIRDGALAASGLLVDSVGGPSVKPYQPAGLWEEKSAGRGSLATYDQDHGEDLYRRTLYTFWKRSSPPPMQIAFDAAARDICEVRRQSTNTPLQALNLLNDPQYVEAARLLAERMIEEGGASARDRIRYGFRVVTSRTPSELELGPLAALYDEELAEFRADRPAALSLLGVGEYRRNPELDPAEVAAYTIVANGLLNLDEAVTER